MYAMVQSNKFLEPGWQSYAWMGLVINENQKSTSESQKWTHSTKGLSINDVMVLGGRGYQKLRDVIYGRPLTCFFIWEKTELYSWKSILCSKKLKHLLLFLVQCTPTRCFCQYLLKWVRVRFLCLNHNRVSARLICGRITRSKKNCSQSCNLPLSQAIVYVSTLPVRGTPNPTHH